MPELREPESGVPEPQTPQLRTRQPGDIVEVEFTIEPFTAGDPGPHVLAAIDAVRLAGIVAEVGPFGTIFRSPVSDAIEIAHNVMNAAIAAGALRISMTMTVVGAP